MVSAADALRRYHAARAQFGATYVPIAPNLFSKVQKNAQEAHEAIRPTAPGVLPAAVGGALGAGTDEARLYRLIWARAMAGVRWGRSEAPRAQLRSIVCLVLNCDETVSLSDHCSCASRFMLFVFAFQLCSGSHPRAATSRPRRCPRQ